MIQVRDSNRNSNRGNRGSSTTITITKYTGNYYYFRSGLFGRRRGVTFNNKKWGLISMISSICDSMKLQQNEKLRAESQESSVKRQVSRVKTRDSLLFAPEVLAPPRSLSLFNNRCWDPNPPQCQPPCRTRPDAL